MSTHRLLVCVAILATTAVAIHLENDLETYLLDSDVSGEVRLQTEDDDWLDSRPGVKRLWGVADTLAIVGRLFRYSIPKDAFSGSVVQYQVQGPNGKSLPAWLHFNEDTATFEGIPTEKDIGQHYITVKALASSTSLSYAKDVFSIDVLDHGTQVELSTQYPCQVEGDHTVLTVVLDTIVTDMGPRERARVLHKFAKLFELSEELLQLISQDDDLSLDLDDVLMAGPGNVISKQHKQTSVVELEVGCDGEILPSYQSTISAVQSAARSGKLGAAVGFPVIGWHVSVHGVHHREKRQVGSGDGYYDDTDEELPPTRIIPTMASPVFPEPSTTSTPSSEHPHRHHHSSEESRRRTSRINIPQASPVLYHTPLMTPSLVPSLPTRVVSTISVEPTRSYDVTLTPSEPIEEHHTVVRPSYVEETSSYVTQPLPTSTVLATVTESEIIQPISPSVIEPTVTTTQVITPTTTTTTTTINGVKNFQPVITNRLAFVPVNAGEVLRHKIPSDTFHDLEDGNTPKLQLFFKTEEGRQVPANSWIQFDPIEQEVYALPLEDNIGKWTFLVEAMDSDGASVTEKLAVAVRQHKGSRTVNHEFTLHLRPAKKYDLMIDLDWKVLVAEKLAELFGDSDTKNVFVRRVTTRPMTFTWTNISLPRDHCPEEEIDSLLKKLVASQTTGGAVSPKLKHLLHPKLQAKKISMVLKNHCENFESRFTKPTLPAPHQNQKPVKRNPLDKISATVGKVLKFQVPEDAFYDFEDGNTRRMKVKLLTMDRVPVPISNWLQFDENNQEFYGLPLMDDIGRTEYVLVCTDSSGDSINEVLEVFVAQTPSNEKFSVEFSITLDTGYDEFVRSTPAKTRAVEKIAGLFGDRNSSHIVVKSITKGSVVLAWYNSSLPYEPCPHEELEHLRKVLLTDEGRVSPAAQEYFADDFDMIGANVIPLGVCIGEGTPTHEPTSIIPTSDATPKGREDDKLITFIVPAVIIAVMLLVAGIIACLLYRKRRKGKMTMEENKTFINKGIPIIFADELEDKSAPAKSPVILKDEKPPLPPPDYLRNQGTATPPTPPIIDRHNHARPDDIDDSSPYQPPPPFTAGHDNRQNRPKPTPTYRKPPPYVPP